MKINILGQYNINQSQTRYVDRNVSYANFSMPVDTFVKSPKIQNAPISFSSNLKFDDLYFKYIPVLMEYVFSTPLISHFEIQNIINEFSSDIKVLNYSDVKDALPEDAKACYSSVIYQKDDTKPLDKTMYLNIPTDLTDENRKDFCEQLIHETIHLMQDEAVDRESSSALAKKIFELSNADFETKSFLYDSLKKNFSKLESFIQKAINLVYVQYDEESKKEHGDNRDDNFLNQLHVAFKKRLRKANLCFIIFKKDFPNNDNIFYNSMIEQAMREKEAYEKSYNMLACDEKKAEMEKIRIKAYQALIDEANLLINETRYR